MNRTLSVLPAGEHAEVTAIGGDADFRRRLLELGLAPGAKVRVVRAAPLGDPIEIEVRGFRLVLRRAEAAEIALGPHNGDAAALDAPTPAPVDLPSHPTEAERAAPTKNTRRCRVALAGNPNTGKTTLFNLLTGARAKVGNFPGVTVERQLGDVELPSGTTVELVDIPGTYSVNARSQDEELALAELVGLGGSPAPDAVVVILSATALERSLYLLLQLREFGLPVVAAVNLLDEAAREGLEIDLPQLARRLKVPVVGLVARTGRGVPELLSALDALLAAPPPPLPERWPWQTDLEHASVLDGLRAAAGAALGKDAPPTRRQAFALSRLMAPADGTQDGQAGDAVRAAVAETRRQLAKRGEDLDLTVSHGRYRYLERQVRPCLRHTAPAGRTPRTERIDAFLTHPVGGLLIFLVVLALIFTAIFDWAAPLMDAIDQGFGRLSQWLGARLPASLWSDLLANGVVKGVGSVLTFLPQIVILFLLLTLLEGTGYMARAAFMMDRVMRKIGLHGRALVPMISGYACAIPAVMATRTIENPRDRLLTMLVIPLVSCSARLPVYTLLIGALFHAERKVLGPLSLGVVLMILTYLVSTLLTLLAAAVLGRTVLKGKRLPLLIELPPYRLPTPRVVALVLWHRVRMFLRTAGTIIVVASVVLWALLAFPREARYSQDYEAAIRAAGPNSEAAALLRTQQQGERVQQSYAGRVGHFIEPALTPLGFDWKIGIGLVGAFAAREVFVATMGLVYGVGQEVTEKDATLRQALRNQRRPDGRPVYTPLTGLSLIVFFMIAMQCLSTVAVVRQESRSWGWTTFMVGYLWVAAYLASLATYQLGRLLGFE
ncbi:MAG: ferrous iron transport protein B [Deltaproteobacteria bacterium]|nr:ferrous iron transport protein B [Deltaproteobacteria bacterium]